MKLSELNTGEKGVIVKVSGHGGFRKRIIVGAIGMLPELRVQRYCLFLKPPNIF